MDDEAICTDCPHPWERHLEDGCRDCSGCPNALLSVSTLLFGDGE